jgi:hypothetical protein
MDLFIDCGAVLEFGFGMTEGDGVYSVVIFVEVDPKTRLAPAVFGGIGVEVEDIFVLSVDRRALEGWFPGAGEGFATASIEQFEPQFEPQLDHAGRYLLRVNFLQAIDAWRGDRGDGVVGSEFWWEWVTVALECGVEEPTGIEGQPGSGA